MKRLIIIAIIFFAVWQMGCKDDTPMDMSPSQKSMVDTLFTRFSPILRAELDSLCDVNFDAQVNVAVDSILALRLREKEALLNRSK